MFERQNFPIYQYVAMITGCLNLFSDGMQYGWPAVSLPILLDKNSTIQMTNEEGSSIVIMLLVGAIVGALVTMAFLDKLGRKYFVLGSSVLLCLAWIIVANATSIWMLMVGRFMGGLADGPIHCATAVYLAEISNPNIRGFINSSMLLCSVMGMLLINVIGLYCDLFTTALIATIFPILCLLTFVWLPRSPYFLLMQGNVDEAKKSLQTFKPRHEVEFELNRLKIAVKEQNENSGKCLDLFTVPSNRRALYIMTIGRFTQQCSGITAITFYVSAIFSECGKDSVLFRYGPIIYFSIQVLLIGFSNSIIDRAGRRLLMIISLSGAAVALFAFSCYFYIANQTNVDVKEVTFIPIAALLVFIISFNIGMFTIPFVLVGEIFPTNVKAFAVGLSDLYFSIIGMVVTKFFQISKDSYGLHVPFAVFFVCSVIGCFLIAYFIPETKGKTLEEIQDLLKHK